MGLGAGVGVGVGVGGRVAPTSARAVARGAADGRVCGLRWHKELARVWVVSLRFLQRVMGRARARARVSARGRLEQGFTGKG